MGAIRRAAIMPYNPDFRFKERILFRKGADGIPKRVVDGWYSLLLLPDFVPLGEGANRRDKNNQEGTD